jgi:opacity protein-like surface antigen
MKRLFLGSIALAALGTSAFAADMQVAPAPVAAPVYTNWSGLRQLDHVQQLLRSSRLLKRYLERECESFSAPA